MRMAMFLRKYSFLYAQLKKDRTGRSSRRMVDAVTFLRRCLMNRSMSSWVTLDGSALPTKSKNVSMRLKSASKFSGLANSRSVFL